MSFRRIAQHLSPGALLIDMPVNASETRVRACAFAVMLEKLSVLATLTAQFVACSRAWRA
jgi:hypothetical protein